MIGHLVRPADFERVLGTPSRARSRHFAVHYLASRPARRQPQPSQPELSTAPASGDGAAVDDLAPEGCWLGLVVPKRHARRSVTRALLKRQIRHAVGAAQASLPQGLWVVRLRSPFERSEFPSAASQALRDAAASELHTVLAQAARKVGA